MGKTITAALAKRQKQSAIVSEMMLNIVAAVRRAAHRKKNFSGLFEEWLVAMAIRQNEGRGGEPLTVACIARILGIPRSNAKRAVDALIVQGRLRKEGAGFAADLGFLKRQINADYFKVVVVEILKAADGLHALDTAR